MVPQSVQELESEESQHDTDAWSTRQSTMEERVIDRYVIDTHPTPMFGPESGDMHVDHQLPTTDEEEEEVSEPEVVVSSASAPGPPPPLPSQHQQETNSQQEETEEEVLISSSWNAPNQTELGNDEVLESEFTAALEEENVNTFSPELLSRSLEQQRNGKFPLISRHF